MSLAADPNQTVEIFLESDKELPADKRPVFLFRYLTCRQWKTLISIREKMKDAKTTVEVTDICIEIIRLNLCGWKNVVALDGSPVPFSLEKIEDIFSPDDIYDLMTAGKAAQSLSDEDKKKLDSPSPCDSDNAAPESAKA